MKTFIRAVCFGIFFLGLTSCAGQQTPTALPAQNTATPSSPNSPDLAGEPSSTPPPPLTPDTPTPQPPTPTPIPQLIQLTTNGCCVQPFFSPDSTGILFLDKPAADLPTGFYQIPVNGGEPTLHTTKLGIYSPDMQLVAYPQGGQTYVEHLETGERYTVPNGGRALTFSPSGAQVAWTAGNSGPPFDTSLREIRISNFDGTNPKTLLTLIGGGFSGWVSETHALVTGRQTLDETESALWVLSISDSSLRELVRGGRIRSITVSPGGTWVAYLVTFASDPAQDGIWVQNIATGDRTKLDLFGGYRWRDADHLLVIPLDPNAAIGPIASHQLWEVDATTGQSRAMTDPTITPFKVASGDWTVSPDGQHIVYVSATDRNIWVLTIQP